jgi:hypothetical protein
MINKYYIDIITNIQNKIWAYKIIFQIEPNTIIIPSKVYKKAKNDIDNINKNIIISDDFKEIKCINIIDRAK